jgi:N-carbamoyl-L-amino-acid hydrolase
VQPDPDATSLPFVPLDPGRTVAELKELRQLTGDENGAQRVAWTETWETARTWLREKVSETGASEEIDEAGNQWFTLVGDSERAVLIGGHIDSVPNGGWLDGALNVMAGVEVLRGVAEAGTPPVTVRLVNWADEEGARFGRSLFGSSAAAGSMADQDELRRLTDQDGISLPDALAEHGVDLDRALEARRQLDSAAAYLELHIEQGPVLESLDLPLGVVLGTFGVERHRITWRGQAAHAGSTPMDQRRDALAGAAKLALEIRDIAARTGDGAVCTSGGVVCRPGIVTSVVETAEQLLDQRHLDVQKLASMLADVREASARFAAEENIDVEIERIWSIEPILFDDTLLGFCEEAIVEVAGTAHRLPSGPLHDAAEVSRAGVPTVMLFVQSLRGLSHTKLENTKEEHLELAVSALDRLTSKTIEWVAGGGGRSA